MAQQTINVGTAPNDGTGTPLRTAFQYTNSNFSELYTAVGPSGNNIVVPGSATITGDLTVQTNKLVVNATGVGAGKTPSYPLDVAGNVSMTGAGTGTRYLALLDETNTYAGSLTIQAGGGSAGFGGGIVLYGHSHATYPGAVWIGRSSTSSGPIMFGDYGTGPGNKFLQLDTGGVCTWFDGAGGTRMTLNSTGLGVGVTPIERLTVAGTASVGGTGNIGVKFHSGNPVTGNLAWLLSNDSANSNILNLYYYNAGVFSGRAFVVNQSGNFMVRTPSTPPTIPDNEMMVFNLTSNTNLRISVKGTDGTVRTANITLA